MREAAIKNFEQLAEQLCELLKALPKEPLDTAAALRSEIRRFVSAFDSLRSLAKVRFKKALPQRGARARILAYFKLFVGQKIHAKELAVVSAISDYGRRIRELRVEHGYNISTGHSRVYPPEDLGPDEYILESATPDEASAEKWRVSNKIRRQKGSSKDRILALLKHFHGQPVTGEQLAYVAKQRDMRRRTGELRTEEGWRLYTRFTGRPDLPNSVYVLENLEQKPPHDRNIPDAIYESVLKRDHFTCRKCGWTIEQRHPASRKQFIEVHHVEHHVAGGTNNVENLVTLCNVDHDEVHRRDIGPSKLFAWLTN